MNILEKARPENSFRCADGSVIGSVYELENRLCTMSSEAFHHHVNALRNDFHNWIRDVFQDYELANELLNAKTPGHAAAIVRKHLRKALLAKEEIEDAIKTVSTTKTKTVRVAVKAKPAKAAPRQKRQKPTKRKKTKPKSSEQHRQQPMRIDPRSIARLGPVDASQLGKAAAITKATKNKNRKLNKNSRRNRKKTRSSSNKGGYGKKRGKRAHKRIRKQVNRWLNWLKIVPEM